MADKKFSDICNDYQKLLGLLSNSINAKNKNDYIAAVQLGEGNISILHSLLKANPDKKKDIQKLISNYSAAVEKARNRSTMV